MGSLESMSGGKNMREERALGGIAEFLMFLFIFWFLSGNWKFVVILSGIHLFLIVLSMKKVISIIKLILPTIGLEVFLG